MEKSLPIGLRNFFIKNNISPLLIDFEKTKRGQENDLFQILVLKKPNAAVFEVEDLKWDFKSNVVLLVYEKETQKVNFIETEFNSSLLSLEKEREFDFSRDFCFKIIDNFVMLIARGERSRSRSDCHNINIALFDLNPFSLLGIWETSFLFDLYKEVGVENFSLIKEGIWLTNFFLKTEKGELSRELFVLSTDRVEELRLSLFSLNFKINMLLTSNTQKIKKWTSDDNEEGLPKFLILSSNDQICVYEFYRGTYHKNVDIEYPSIKEFDVSFNENLMKTTLKRGEKSDFYSDFSFFMPLLKKEV